MKFLFKVKNDPGDTYIRMRLLTGSRLPHFIQKVFIFMRLVTLILFLTAMHVTAGSLEAQRVSINKKEATLLEVLEIVRKQTGYLFVCDMEMIRKTKPVSLNLRQADMLKVLDAAFKDQPVTYSIYDKTIIVQKQPSGKTAEPEDYRLPNLKKPVEESREDREMFMTELSEKLRERALITTVADIYVKGRIVDETNTELPGVSIVLKGSLVGTTTDEKGEFSLRVPDSKGILVFSYVGYITQEVSFNSQTRLDIVMKEDQKSLEEIVVVGYGTQSKRDITGSVSSVKSEELMQTPITNVAQGIQARVPGVHITQNSAAPGGNISVRIRGTNSINGSSEPLYVVDGIQISNGGSITQISPLSTINPNDIESVEVLKDASATAIYGSRGANGVILITTKRGKNAPTKVQFDTYVGVQKITRKLGVLNSRQFAELENETFPTPPYPDIESITEETNWQDLIYRQAAIQSYQLSLQGGDKKTRFSVSGNYFDQDGIIIKSNFKRYSLRATLDHEINDKTKTGITILGSHSVNRGIPTGITGVNNANSASSIVGAALGAPPTLQPYRDNGTIFPFVDQGGGRYAEVVNPLALAEIFNQTGVTRFLSNFYVDRQIIKDLTYRASFNVDISNSLNDYYSPIYIIPESMVNSNSGTARKTNENNRSLLHESILTYYKDFGKNSLKFTGVYAVQTIAEATNSINATGFPNDQTTNEALGLAVNRIVSSNRTRQDLVSFMGRVNYAFDGKYFLDVTARYDGASKFGKNNKYGFFPAISGAWRIIGENFMADQSVFSNLKLRASYGVTGNAAAIGPYQSLSLSGQKGAYYFNHQYVTGISPTGIANTDLRWERSKQANIGLDMSFLKDRLDVVVDVYTKKTEDLLFARDLPMSSGYGSYTGNFAVLRNKGIELGINYNVSNSAFRWDVGGNLSVNRNRLLALEGDESEFVVSEFSVLKVGQPIGVFRTYIFDGIYQLGEEVLPGQTSRIGATKLKDLNNDGSITAEDQKIIGNPNPDIIFGLSSNMSYKKFDLSLFFSGVLGNDVYNLSRYTFENPLGSRNVLAGMANRWSPTNPNNEYQNGSQGGRLPVSDRFLENGSFVRLKNINLGYTFNDLAGISALRLYVSGNNLFTFTRYSGYDPEVNSYGGSNTLIGVDNLVYPNSKSYLMGIQVSF